MTRILGLLLVLAVVACAPSETTPTIPTEALNDPHRLVPPSGPHRESIAEVINRYADLPFTPESIEFHQEVFSDGEVTYAEYERIMHAVAQCVRELGHTIDGPLYWPDGGLSIEPGVDPRWIIAPYLGRDVNPDFLDDSTWCQETWQWRIERVYFEHVKPTEAEVQIWLDAAWQCAREKGIPISDPPDYSTDIVKVISPTSGCEPWMALPPR